MRNVYNYNAVGVIVYNDRDSQNLDKMQILDRDRKLFKSGHIVRVGQSSANLVNQLMIHVLPIRSQ